MNEVKGWLTSKTVWSSIIGTTITALHAFGVHIGFLDNIDAEAFAGHLADIASGLFFLAAGVFRVTATAKLKA